FRRSKRKALQKLFRFRSLQIRGHASVSKEAPISLHTRGKLAVEHLKLSVTCVRSSRFQMDRNHREKR
ncbi:MAG: hypothetical protein P8O10_03845, partial [Pseudorhodobacter sp.]|nr:hypothetical protein [Pseudorhodobacter sp.]